MFRLRVKEVAEQKGFKKARLGRLADITPHTINKIFRDPYTNVAYSTLRKIADVLGVEVSDLTEDVPEEKGEGK